MPKGVEHFKRYKHPERVGWVSPSLMPKGVEHTETNKLLHELRGVSPSLMPKGVEHGLGKTLQTLWCCVPLPDAERR